MKIKSKHTFIGTARSVKRHVLRFETLADIDEAVKINKEEGFVQFRNEGEDLVGRIFRIAPKECVIEIDAAKDTNEEVGLFMSKLRRSGR